MTGRSEVVIRRGTLRQGASSQPDHIVTPTRPSASRRGEEAS
jgi:hypothetical protein